MSPMTTYYSFSLPWVLPFIFFPTLFMPLHNQKRTSPLACKQLSELESYFFQLRVDHLISNPECAAWRLRVRVSSSRFRSYVAKLVPPTTTLSRGPVFKGHVRSRYRRAMSLFGSIHGLYELGHWAKDLPVFSMYMPLGEVGLVTAVGLVSATGDVVFGDRVKILFRYSWGCISGGCVRI